MRTGAPLGTRPPISFQPGSSFLARVLGIADSNIVFVAGSPNIWVNTECNWLGSSRPTCKRQFHPVTQVLEAGKCREKPGPGWKKTCDRTVALARDLISMISSLRPLNSSVSLRIGGITLNILFGSLLDHSDVLACAG